MLFWLSVGRNDFVIDTFCVSCEAKSIFSRIIQVTFSLWRYKIWSLVCRRLHLVKEHKSINYCHIKFVSDFLLAISNRRILKCFPLNCSTTVFKENNIDIVEVLKFCGPEVLGSILGGVSGDFFPWFLPTKPCALRSQPPKMSTRDFSRVKGGRCLWLTIYHPCSAKSRDDPGP